MNYIIIIDDSVTIRNSVELVIKDFGFGIKHAENGVEALDIVKEIKNVGNDVALCIVDVNMPVMDGITFVQEFRKLDKFTPLLMLTTEAGESSIQAGKKAGASGWIIKPFRVEQLIDTIKKFLK